MLGRAAVESAHWLLRCATIHSDRTLGSEAVQEGKRLAYSKQTFEDQSGESGTRNARVENWICREGDFLACGFTRTDDFSDSTFRRSITTVPHHRFGEPAPEEPVFLVQSGAFHNHDELAKPLRAALATAEVSRTELHNNGKNLARLRAHDPRDPFITP